MFILKTCSIIQRPSILTIKNQWLGWWRWFNSSRIYVLQWLLLNHLTIRNLHF